MYIYCTYIYTKLKTCKIMKYLHTLVDRHRNEVATSHCKYRYASDNYDSLRKFCVKRQTLTDN